METSIIILGSGVVVLTRGVHK